MAKWYYYNEQHEKIEVTGGQLKGLAKIGKITPNTIVETEDGKTAPARRVKGLLFPELLTTAERTQLPAVTSPAVTSPIVPSEDSPPTRQIVETNPFTAAATEAEVTANPFTADYTQPEVNPFTQAYTQGQVPQLQSSVQNIITVLFTPSKTKTESKQKGKIWGGICLGSLVPLAYILVPRILELTNTGLEPRWGEFIPHTIPFALLTLISLCFWLWELALQGEACPRCDKVNTRKTLTWEDKNFRHVTEKRAITRTNDEGKTVYTGEYEDVQKTKYDCTYYYQCTACNHKWEETHKDITKDGWV